MYNETQNKATQRYVKKCKRVGFVLTPAVYNVWHEFSEKLNLPMNTMLRQAVDRWMEEEKQK